MILTTDVKYQQRLKRSGQYLVLIVLAIALLVMVGWQFDIKGIIHPLSKLPPMNPISAVAFGFFSLSYLLLTRSNPGKKRQQAGKLFAVLTLVIGGIKVISTPFKFDSHIDTFL